MKFSWIIPTVFFSFWLFHPDILLANASHPSWLLSIRSTSSTFNFSVWAHGFIARLWKTFTLRKLTFFMTLSESYVPLSLKDCDQVISFCSPGYLCFRFIFITTPFWWRSRWDTFVSLGHCSTHQFRTTGSQTRLRIYLTTQAILSLTFMMCYFRLHVPVVCWLCCPLLHPFWAFSIHPGISSVIRRIWSHLTLLWATRI